MRFALCFALVCLCIPALAHAGVEGTYSVDKKRLLKDMSSKISKLPKRRQAFAKIALGMAKSMKFTFTLKRRGAASASMSMKVFGKTKSKKGTGSWKQTKNGSIRIELKSVSTKGKTSQDVITCKPQGKTVLACKSGPKKETLYYNKSK
jgi:hypothetical protein